MTMKTAIRAAAALLAIAASPMALAQTIAITGATLAIGDGSEPIQNGTVVISAGKVVAAGAGVAVPAGARTIDASGKWVTPGIVSGFSRVGLAEVPGVKETNDINARTPFSAAIDVAPAINPLANPIAISRTAGVTARWSCPRPATASLPGRAPWSIWALTWTRSPRRAPSNMSRWAKKGRRMPAAADRPPISPSR